MTWLRQRLTYANVMVTLLAFVVLCGGGAYAASQLDKGSVGPRQLKKNAVNSAKVKDGSLRPGDFAAGTLQPGPRGATGPTGPTGLQGVPGISRGFQASGSVNYDKFSAILFGSTVVNLPLPPGSYFATASVQVQTVNAVASSVICRLINVGGGGESTVTQRSQVARADGESDNFTLTALFDVAAGQSLNLQCSKSAPGASARVNSANIVAVQISSASGSSD